MSILERFLRWKATEKTEPQPGKYAEYEVEEYPGTFMGTHYAKYRGNYLRTNLNTGIVEAWGTIDKAEGFGGQSAEERAWALVDKHLEQKTKQNVIVKRR